SQAPGRQPGVEPGSSRLREVEELVSWEFESSEGWMATVIDRRYMGESGWIRVNPGQKNLFPGNYGGSKRTAAAGLSRGNSALAVPGNIRFRLALHAIKCEIKCRALVYFRVGPDASTMALHDAFDDGQSHACAFKFLGAMQPLKDAEQFVGVFHVEPH